MPRRLVVCARRITLLACLPWLPAPSLAAQETREIEHDGQRRQAIIVNAEAAQDKPRPLWLVLHGRRPADAPNRSSATLDAIAKREGFIAAYPAGHAGSWHFPGQVVPPGSTKSTVDDLGFLQRFIERAIADKLADAKRIYVSGFSAGGFMTYALACALSERIAAAAPLGASMTDAQIELCKPARSMPLLVIAGTADRSVRYDGQVRADYRITSIPETLEFWRRLHGCRSQNAALLAQRNADDPTRTERIEWSLCKSGGPLPLALYRIDGGGHTLPSLTPQTAEEEGRNGRRSRDFETSEVVWAFLKQWSLP